LISQLGVQGVTPQTEALVEQALAAGEAALNGKDWTGAADAYERALALDPSLVVAHSALAYVYAQQGRLDEAERENLAVLEALPDDYATLMNLAIIYRELGRYDEAIRRAQQALDSPNAVAEQQAQLRAFITETEALK
jgi:tetratricopeptide (TPR) repeat protein